VFFDEPTGNEPRKTKTGEAMRKWKGWGQPRRKRSGRWKRLLGGEKGSKTLSRECRAIRTYALLMVLFEEK